MSTQPISDVIRAHSEAEWVKETTVLQGENTSDRRDIIRNKKIQLRVINGFSFWRGNKPVDIRPDTALSGIELRGTVASLNGASRFLVQAWNLDIEYECMDAAPMKLTHLLEIKMQSHRSFRGGKERCLWVTTDKYAYALLEEEDFYMATWTNYLQLKRQDGFEWDKLKKVSRSEMPDWWRGRDAEDSWRAYLDADDGGSDSGMSKGETKKMRPAAYEYEAGRTIASGASTHAALKRKSGQDEGRTVRFRSETGGIRQPRDESLSCVPYLTPTEEQLRDTIPTSTPLQEPVGSLLIPQLDSPSPSPLPMPLPLPSAPSPPPDQAIDVASVSAVLKGTASSFDIGGALMVMGGSTGCSQTSTFFPPPFLGPLQPLPETQGLDMMSIASLLQGSGQPVGTNQAIFTQPTVAGSSQGSAGHQPLFAQNRYVDDFDPCGGFGYLLDQLDEPPQGWMDPWAPTEAFNLEPDPFTP